MFMRALRRLPEKSIWPHDYYEIEDKFCDVEVDGFRIRARYKEAGAGAPLVLVHGLMTSSYSWRYNIGPLSKRFRVIAPDLVGAGRTDKPLDFDYSLRGFAGFLHSFVHAIGVAPAYVVGNSLGGLYTLSWAAGYPEDFSGLIVEHCPGFFQFRLLLLGWLLRFGPLVRRARALIHRNRMGFVATGMHYRRDGILSLEEVREYSSLFDSPDGVDVFFNILRQSLDLKRMKELRRTLAGVRFDFPVRLLFSTEDKLVPPKFGKKFARLLGIPIIWVRDSSHFIHVDQPDRFHEIVLEVFGR